MTFFCPGPGQRIQIEAVQVPGFKTLSLKTKTLLFFSLCSPPAAAPRQRGPLLSARVDPGGPWD